MLDTIRTVVLSLWRCIFMSKKSSRAYPEALILEIIQANEEKHIGPSQLARDYQVSVNTVKLWLKEYRKSGYAAFGGNKRLKFHAGYDGKFKQRVMLFWDQHPEQSCYQICQIFSLSRTTVRQWKKVYDDKGLDTLIRETRGAKRKVERQKAIVKSKKTDSEKLKELESQIEYLQAENEYLKKLNALTYERKLQQTKRSQL